MWLTVLANDASTSWNSMPDVSLYSRTASCSRCFDSMPDNGNWGRQGRNWKRRGRNNWLRGNLLWRRKGRGEFQKSCKMMVCLKLTHNVIRIYQKSCWRQLSYCGLHVRAVSVFGKKSDAVCGFLAYFCAVLRFSDPPYAPLHK